MNAFNRNVARVLIGCMLGLGLPLPALAGIVTTDQISAGVERDRIQSFIDRSDVQAKMQALGVDSNTVQQRVDALTDDEAAQLASRIDQLPAGGNIIGVLFTVFVILLVTDILGFTKVFSFTRPIQ